ncbi:hypothetical protein ACTMU2_05270, partial [Cupriavidus basilensis]
AGFAVQRAALSAAEKEIMKRFLRFVNRVSNLFASGQSRQLRASTTLSTRNPCYVCFAAPRCVARGQY